MAKIFRCLRRYPLLLVIFIAALTFQLAGMAIGFMGMDDNYDKVAHFLLPATGAPILYALLAELNILKPLKTFGLVFTIFAIGVAAEAVWEIIEYLIDMSAQSGLQRTLTDTILDMVMAVFGSLLGGIYFAVRYNNK